MADFDLSREIDRYAARICQDIRSGRKRRAVKQEYVEHLEDASDRYMMKGMSEEQALRAACEDLGDLSEMQTLLAVAHNGDGLLRWFKWVMGVVAAFEYDRWHVPDKENVHILLLSPIPFEVSFDGNGQCKKLTPVDPLTAPYGYAHVCSPSDFIRLMSAES